jgi:predicted dehydrogenase
VLSARAKVGPPGIDVAMTADLWFANGATGRVDCSMERGLEFLARLEVRGERGELVAENPIAPQYGNRIKVKTPDFERTETAPRETTYRYQLEAFVDAVLRGQSPITSGADSVANMDAIDAIYRAAGLSPRPRVTRPSER